MFETLSTSQRPAVSGVHRYLVALGIHGALALAAVKASEPTPASAPLRSAEAIALVAPQVVRQSPPPVSADDPRLVRPAPPTWSPEVDIPELGQRVHSVPETAVASLLEGLAAVPGTAPANVRLGDGGALPSAAGPLDPALVDEPVQVLHQPVPRYPTALARAAISDRVELEYVVDTMGRAESASLRALRSTGPEFEAAARASVLAARFKPARLRGTLVRQLVRQTLTFRPADY
jgi:TonB family protein